MCTLALKYLIASNADLSRFKLASSLRDLIMDMAICMDGIHESTMDGQLCSATHKMTRTRKNKLYSTVSRKNG